MISRVTPYLAAGHMCNIYGHVYTLGAVGGQGGSSPHGMIPGFGRQIKLELYLLRTADMYVRCEIPGKYPKRKDSRLL